MRQGAKYPCYTIYAHGPVQAWHGSVAWHQHQAYLNEFVLHILDKIQPRRAIVLQYEDRQVSVAKSHDKTVAEDKHWA